MKITILISIVSLMSVFASFAESFTASSLTSPFAVAGDIKGTYTFRSRVLTVDVQSGYIIRQPFCSFPKRHISGVCAFIADWTRDKTSFTMLAKSDVTELNEVLDLNETLPLNGFTFKIPIKDLSKADLRKTWLGFEIISTTPKQDGKSRTGFSYVHTSLFLMSEEPTGFPKQRE